MKKTKLFFGKNKANNDRMPVVAGQFYSDNPIILKNNVINLFSKSEYKQIQNITAVITPHAGFMYSGEVAASAFKQIDENKKYEYIFIICTSHRMTFEGAAVYNSGNYITPLGKIEVDTEIANKLIEKNPFFIVNDKAHLYEHSLEVQLPFLQVHLKKAFKIVPIILGTYKPEIIKKIANTLKPFFNSENLFIISSDFSHYPNYEDACIIDDKTAEIIISNNVENLLNHIKNIQKYNISNLSTPVCGWTSVLVLMYLTNNNDNYIYHKIKYMNSGDISGDISKVVGYWSIVVEKNNKKSTYKPMPELLNKNSTDNEFLLSDNDKITLLKIARNTLNAYIIEKKFLKINTQNISEKLLKQYGAFVSLHKKGKLRGCIGKFTSNMPVYNLVSELAISSATNDSRFNPVEEKELNDIDIEISILTPLKKINSPDEIVLGKHGIYIELNNKSGTFLPQVATQTGWSKEEFLGYCSRDKAEIGWNGWQKANLYTYEAFVFSEHDFLKQ